MIRKIISGEFKIEEHYTDTHGYTEINFAAFAMLGLRFCPRIRGVQHQRIYRIDPNCDYGSLASLVSRAGSIEHAGESTLLAFILLYLIFRDSGRGDIIACFKMTSKP